MDTFYRIFFTFIWISLTSLSLTLSFFFLKIFTGKSITSPEYPPVKGTVFNLLFNYSKMFDYHTQLAFKHSTFRFLAPARSLVFTTDSRSIENVLKTHFDKYSRGQHNKDMATELFGEGIFGVDSEKWRRQREARQLRVLSEDLLMRCTLDSIFKVGFGVELNCLEGSSKEGIAFMKAFNESHSLLCWRYFDPSWKLKRILNLGSEASLRKNIKLIDEFVQQLIKKKRMVVSEPRDCNDKEDILSRFLKESEKDPEQMNDKYLRDIVLNFVIAGKDTTTNALSWFLYMMCKNSVIQEKVAGEIRDIVGARVNEANIDDFVANTTVANLEQMHYLHAALKETLRLYPAVPMDGRSTDVDDILPDGFKVKKGDDVCYMAYAMARMPHIWGKDYEDFKPERWLKDGTFQPESPFKFISFHAGPRSCLGKEFAYWQMKIVSMALLHFSRFKLADETKPVNYRVMFTLHIDGALPLCAVPRASS